jgi:predicted methyltransferase
MRPVILSHYQATPLLRARKAGQASVRTSIDLNLTQTLGQLSDAGLVLPDGRVVPWAAIEQAEENENGCFAVEGDVVTKIQAFSETTGRMITLYPTPAAPTILISGIPMHRIKGTDPIQDTLAKLRAIGTISGRVLDTATGLGYTACLASRRNTREVVTIELDPAVLEVAHQNPWSKELFESPKITQLEGDASELIRHFPDEWFDYVIHDPPAFSLAGEMYSADFYTHLLRVLAPGGRVFHYLGDPESRLSGNVTRSAVRRMKEAGFGHIIPHPEAFGVVASR